MAESAVAAKPKKERSLWIENILARTWLWKLDEEALYCAPIDPGESLLRHVRPKEEYEILERNVSLWESGVPAFAGHRISFQPAFRELASRWLNSLLVSGSRPCLLYARRRMDLAQINCVVVTSCADYAFLTQEYREHSVFYRNQSQVVVVVQLPDLPDLTEFRRKWTDWVSNRHVIGSSARYFVELTDAGRFLIRSFGVDSVSMRALRDAGFVWDREEQIWTGQRGRVREDELHRIVSEDDATGPERLGFVPEWYADAQLWKKRASRRYTLDAPLWDGLFGLA